MKFLTVDTFIKEVVHEFPNARDVYVTYIVDDSISNPYGKQTTYPMMLVITEPLNKTVLLYNDIVELFEDSLGLTLPKPNIITEGIACCKISTKPEHSAKFDLDFFPRKHVAVSEKVVKTVNELKEALKERQTPEVLDI